MDMNSLLQGIVTGLLLGGFYTSLSVGLSLSWGVMRVVNVAHVSFGLLTAYITLILFEKLGLDPFLCITITAPILLALGFLLQTFFIKTKCVDPFNSMIVTIGLFTIIENMLILFYSVDYQTIRVGYRLLSYKVGSTVISFPLLIAFAGGVLMTALLQIFLNKTWFGRAIRATAEDSQTAEMLGVPVKIIGITTIGIASASVVVFGTLLGIIGTFYPSVGGLWLGRMFSIVIAGGMGSLLGTLVAGLLVGLMEGLTSALLFPSWSAITPFILLVIILLLRPKGLLGGK